MLLESLFEVISIIIKDTKDIKRIIEHEKVKEVAIAELTQISDQNIREFLESKTGSVEEYTFWFEIFQRLKVEQSINDISDEIIEDSKGEKIQIIQKLFNDLVEPDDIEVTDDKICIRYNLGQDEKLEKKINEIIKWNRDNVAETISKTLGIDIENIAIIDSVGSYIEFISSFDESNYVSRGQKDCKYKLEPSLHRIYNDSFQLHSSQYESTFKQRILYYDDTTEKKTAEELRAYGQHYGLPTNYLDFTEAHLISLLFAVEEYEYIENHSIVYFVDALSYNRDNVRAERKLVDFSDEKLKATLEAEYSDKSYFIRVGNCNERIHFQKGCFLKVEHRDNLSKMFEKYTKIAIIDKEFKKDILKELFKLGITFENIYPDKDNMVKTIKFIKEHM